MRIGVITTSYPRFDGDPAGGFVAEQVAWLACAGHEVDVVCAGDGQESGLGCGQESGLGCGQESGLAMPAVAITRVDGGGLFYRGGAPEALAGSRRAHGRAAAFVARLAAAVMRRRHLWDAVIAHWLVPCGVVAATTRLPMVAIAHSGDVHLLRACGGVTPVAAALVAARARLVFVSAGLQARFLAAVSWPSLARRVNAASTVCPMGVDVMRLARARAAAGAASEQSAAFVGRLVPIKGARVAVAAAALSERRVTLTVAGDGPEAARVSALMRRLCPGRARWIGEVRGGARDALLGRATLALVPSLVTQRGRTEGLPVVALEAMAAGAAVIASPVGGLRELPPAAVTWAAPGDPRAWAAAMDGLIGDDARRAQQAAAARAFVAERDWRVVGPRLLPA